MELEKRSPNISNRFKYPLLHLLLSQQVQLISFKYCPEPMLPVQTGISLPFESFGAQAAMASPVDNIAMAAARVKRVGMRFMIMFLF